MELVVMYCNPSIQYPNMRRDTNLLSLLPTLTQPHILLLLTLNYYCSYLCSSWGVAI